jgi:hypothetical protein
MIATNKWIISSPTPFSTSVQCDNIFTSVNLKTTTIVEIPEGCSMHLHKAHILARILFGKKRIGNQTLKVDLGKH